jgi:hypothetical protein
LLPPAGVFALAQILCAASGKTAPRDAERHRDAANRIGSTIFASQRRPIFHQKK